MKNIIKNIILSLIALVTITSCSSSSVDNTTPATLTKLAITLKSGQEASAVAGTEKTVDLTTLYTVTATPTGASSAVTWSVDPAYPGVSITGGNTLTIATTAAAGNVTLKATSTTVKTKNATAIYTINEATAATVPVTALSLARKIAQTTTTGTVGTDVNLTTIFDVTVTPTTATDSSVTWTIDPAQATVATLTTAGVLTPVGAGTVMIKVTSVSETGVSSTTTPFAITATTATAPTSLEIGRKTPDVALAMSGTRKTVDLTAFYSITSEPATANSEVTWTVDPPKAGVTISGTTLTIAATATVGNITLKATTTSTGSTVNATTIYTITVPAVSTLALAVKTGQIASAVRGTAQTFDVTKIFDVNPTPTQASNAVTWSVDPAYAGATISGTILSITAAAVATTATTKIVIKATSTTVTTVNTTTDFILLASAPALTALALVVKDGKIASAVRGTAQTFDVTELFDVNPTPQLAANTVTWTVDPAYAGATISGTTLSITAAAVATTAATKVVIKATSTTVTTVNTTTNFILLASAPALTALALVVKDGKKASGPVGAAQINLTELFDVNPTPQLANNAVTWTVDPAKTGVTIATGSSTLAILATATAGPVTIRATPNPAVAGVTAATFIYTITPIVTGISIAVKPGQTASATHGVLRTIDLTELYTVTATPTGANNEVIWSVEAAYPGALIDGTTLTITETSGVTTFMLRATSTEVPGQSSTTSFTLN